MSSLIRRRWVSFVLLCIIVPMGLLAAFRLTGIIPEPPATQTITVDMVSWNMSRPKVLDTIDIDQRVENFYAGDVASINFSVLIVDYFEYKQGYPSWGNSFLRLQVNATANVSEGFVESLSINFSKTDTYAFLLICRDQRSMELRNITITRIKDPATSEYEAYVEATGPNQPKDCLLSILNYWVLTDKNGAQDHWITLTLQVIYFNGRAYERVVVPILLGVLAS